MGRGGGTASVGRGGRATLGGGRGGMARGGGRAGSLTSRRRRFKTKMNGIHFPEKIVNETSPFTLEFYIIR